jgi:hypothetical protein
MEAISLRKASIFRDLPALEQIDQKKPLPFHGCFQFNHAPVKRPGERFHLVHLLL